MSEEMQRYLVEIIDSCRHRSARWEGVVSFVPPKPGMSGSYSCWSAATGSGISSCDDCTVKQTIKILNVEPYSAERAEACGVKCVVMTLDDLLSGVRHPSLDAFAHLEGMEDPG